LIEVVLHVIRNEEEKTPRKKPPRMKKAARISPPMPGLEIPKSFMRSPPTVTVG